MRRRSSQLHIRLTAVLCALLLTCALFPAVVSAAPLGQGETGSLSWSLSNGTLTVSGDGAIPDYTERSPAPWYEYRDSILRLKFQGAITAVGTMAFYDCAVLVSADLPSSVQTVGDMAFAGCESLVLVRMPAVTSLGHYAFSRCFALEGVTLPSTLTAIGDYAFYRCESLASIRVPASVTSLGGSAFAYCASLLRADVAASIDALPEWCFYGCESLTVLILSATVTAVGDSAFTRCDALDTVYHSGTDEQRQAVSDAIAESLPGFTISQMSSASSAPPTVEHTDTVVEGDTVEQITTEITQQEDVTVRVEQTVTYPAVDGVIAGNPDSFNSTIYVTFGGESGWDTLMDEIRHQIDEKDSFENNYGDTGSVQAQVTLQNDLPITGEWLENLAGRDATVTVITPDGSRFIVNGNHIVGYEFEKSYYLTYTLTPVTDLDEDMIKTVGTATCYWLSFTSAFAFPVTVEVLVDPYATKQSATLYEQIPKASLLKVQSARVDEDGYVAFHLAVINTTTRYLLAVNVADIVHSEILVPDDTEGVEDFVSVLDKYATTDVRGWLGMTMQEFTRLVLIAVGAFVGVILLLVLFFIIRSKRKAKLAAIRAEVMGTDALEEYDPPEKEKPSVKKLKNPFKKDKE